MIPDALFLNHLLFMAAHRGAVSLSGRDFHIQGPIDELISFVPGSPRSAIPAGCPAVRLAPWSGNEGWQVALERDGFKRAEALTYMELANSLQPLAHPKDIKVTAVTNRRSADIFADIQARGFATGDAAIDRWWREFFLTQARNNYDHPAQRFFLGWTADEAATSMLVVLGAGVAGIYAVATRPEFRKRGISAAVLERVRSDAIQTGFPRLILQAIAGSYAEAYYAKRGFVRRYISQIWRRPA